MKSVLGILAIFLFGLAADVHSFTYEALQEVDRNVTFIELQSDPDEFIGKNLILGGTIMAINKSRGGSRLEISQLPLDAADQPQDDLRPFGRFLAKVPGVIEKGDYRIGSLVTLIGTVTGTATVTVDNEESVYPVLTVREIRLWQEPVMESRSSPRFERETERIYVYDTPSYPYRGYYYEPYYPWPYFPWWLGWSVIIGGGGHGHDHGHGGLGRFRSGGPVRRGR